MGLGVLATSAATAADTKKIVPATLVFKNGSRPDRPGNCSAAVFAQWKHVAEETSATIRYKWNGKDYSITGRPPFNDHYTWVIHYDAPAGYHWMKVSVSWGDGPKPNDCSSSAAKYRERYSVNATAELTICAPGKRQTQTRSQLPQCGPSECDAAVSELVKANDAIASQWSKLVSAGAIDKVGALAYDMKELQARAALAGTLCRSSEPACARASVALRDSVSKQVRTLGGVRTDIDKTRAVLELVNQASKQRNAVALSVVRACR